MVEKSGVEILDRDVAARGRTINSDAMPDLTHPEFNKLWSGQKHGNTMNDGFQITNGRTRDWVDELEKGTQHTKANEFLTRALLELQARTPADKYLKLLDRVDNTPPFQINNLAKDGKLSEFFSGKDKDEIVTKDLIKAVADPDRNDGEHAVALALLQHLFAGKGQDESLSISEIRKATENLTTWPQK